MRFPILGAAALAALFSFAADAPPAAQPESEELLAIRTEIGRLEAELAALGTRTTDLEGKLAAVDVELALVERRVAEAAAARRLAASELAAAEAAVVRQDEELKRTRRDLARRVAGLYRLGRQGYLRFLLSAEAGSDLVSSIRLVRFLATRDRQAIAQYQTVRAELAGRRDEVKVRTEEVARWVAREAERKGELTALRRSQADLLAETRRDRVEVASRAVDLATLERRLSNLVAGVVRDAGPPLSGVRIQEFRGALEWPIRGRVSAPFGPIADPRYGTMVPHHGIDLETGPGAEIRAVYPGKVLYAEVLDGYGPTVIVQHAGRAFSLYAGLSSLKVERGDMVSLSEALGRASERLYFEIRVDNRPENPLNWLR